MENNDDLKQLIEETLRIGKENQRVLKHLESTFRIYRYLTVLRWLFVVAIAVGAFYFLQPFMQEIAKIYQAVTGNHISLPDFDSFLKSFK
ncbi:MAG: hypothetical protein PHF79_02510 [Candidatus Pacebacteria bacterium]|nr:hypothetical protein [Candidatus Paceibacterota bacterium]